MVMSSLYSFLFSLSIYLTLLLLNLLVLYICDFRDLFVDTMFFVGGYDLLALMEDIGRFKCGGGEVIYPFIHIFMKFFHFFQFFNSFLLQTWEFCMTFLLVCQL